MPRLAAHLTALGVALTLASGLGLVARADIVPPGKKYIRVSHTLTGIACIGDRKLYLFTTTGNGGPTTVRAVTADGPLEVPSGYFASTRLAALTAAQVKALDAARDGKWTEERSDGNTPLRNFVRDASLTVSPSLPFREMVDDGDARISVTYAWKLEGIRDNGLVLTPVVAPAPEKPLPPPG
ncbi:MAG: hypothetical protein U1F43_13255 [Myxococcota bacterium]